MDMPNGLIEHKKPAGFWLPLWLRLKKRRARDVQSSAKSPPPVPLHKKDRYLVSANDAALIDVKMSWSGWSLIAVTVVFVAGIVWAMWAKVEEITQSPGRIVSIHKEQYIQSLEGGILREMLIKEGDIVKVGQPLLRMDDTRAGTFYRESKSKVEALEAMASRLLAEANNTKPKFTDQLKKERSELVANEMAVFTARLQTLEGSISFQQKALQIAQKELEITEPLVEKGIVSSVDLLRLQRQVTELKGRIDEQKNKYRADARAEYSRVNEELAIQRELVNGRQDPLLRTLITSPVNGVVKNIRVNTIGGVIQPAQEILEIVPIDDSLLVEARVKPADVAFLRPGQPATVKITAYDYSIYGGLEATLDYISPDTLRDEVRRDETYYRVQLRTKRNHLLDKKGAEMPIIPGMIAQVEVRTGEKTVMGYLMKPILKAKDALRER